MKITKRQLRRIIREALDPRLGYQDPEAYWKKPRRGSVERSKIIHDKLTKGEDLAGPGKAAWVHDTGKSEDLDEADGFTEKYNDDSALKGDQSKLPDALQKGIIDKTVDDREEREEEEREEKNEGVTLDNMPDAWHQILGNCLGE